MIAAVLIDADGVLINGKRFNETLEKDLGVSKEDSLPFFSGKFLDCLVGKADLKTELMPFLNKWGWNGSVEDFLDYWFKSEHSINEELINQVHILKSLGVKCYIATNQEKYRTSYIVEKMGFGDIFDGTFSSYELGYVKPQAEFFESILTDLRLKPSEVLLVDDTEMNVHAAKELGFHAITYSNIASFKEEILSLPFQNDTLVDS